MNPPRFAVKNAFPAYPVNEARPAGLRLDANENRWGPPPRVVAALRLRPEDIASYPDVGKTAAAAARRLGVSPGRLILTNGADEAIYALMKLFAGRGGRVVMPVPGFAVYAHAASLCGARIKGVPFGPRFEFPLRATQNAVTKTVRLVVLVTPNNPTGTEIPRSGLEAVLEKAARFGLSVICDETYAGFGNALHGRMTRRHPNLIVIGSFSKYFALAGLRLGYVIARPEVISALRTVLPPYSVNAAALAAGLAALKSTVYYKHVRREMVRERVSLAASLRTAGLTVFPSGANFLCVRVGAEADLVRKRLAAAGIFLKSFPADPRLADCLRITVGRPEQNARLAAALKQELAPEGLLFDMDGVLVDVSGSYRRAIERTVFHFTGRRVSAEEIHRCKLRLEMNNDWDAAAALCRARGRTVPRGKLVSVFQEYYLGKTDRTGLWRGEKWLLPPDVLARLASRYRLGIVTGRPRLEARSALHRFHVESHFQVMIAREDAGGRQKPDPFGLRLALRRLGVRRAVYFGDSPADMRAAAAAGIAGVAVRPPGMDRRCGWERRMTDAGAARLAESLILEMEKFT